MGFLKSLLAPPPAPGTVLEADLAMTMVDFFQEHARMIQMGLASEPSDVNWVKIYRVTASKSGVLKPSNGLRFENARIICDGKLQGLGCNGIVPITSRLAPQADGSLRLGMKGPLDALSKAAATCTCGTVFALYVDATVGAPEESYVVVHRLLQPAEARLPIVPFFEADRVDVVRL